MIRDLVLDGPHGGLPVRTYLPAGPESSDGGGRVPRPPSAPALVWAHGGAFAVGDLDMAEADWVARRLAERGVAVVSVDYRLAPLNGEARWGGEVRPGVHFPVALEEIVFAHAWTRQHAHELGADPARVALGGASAGANLAAGATLRLLAGHRQVAGKGSDGFDAPAGPVASVSGTSAPDTSVPWRVLLAYPTLHAIQPPVGEELRSALAEAGLTDQFAPAVVRAFYENYLGSAGPAESAPFEAVPGTATIEQLAGFPPSCITVAELDELRVSAEAFAATLREAGADIELAVEPGATHGYLNRPHEAPRAVDTVERFAALLTGDRPLPPSATNTATFAPLSRRKEAMSTETPQSQTHQTVADLIARSNRLGADKRNTNYAGGNTSAKGTEQDPVTGEDVELLWVKGSGGDLGTLTEQGLAVLRLDRMRALVNVYPGVEREDEMVAAFDYCLHGKGGAAPSIDTAMHGLVDAAHVDHLHPDSGIAIATAVDGEKLTAEIFGDQVVWVPWRRPGFQLGLDIARIKEQNPQAIGCILGGHGITAWGDTAEESEQNSLHIIRTAEQYIAEHGRKDPFGAAKSGFGALPEAERRAKAAALAPVIRGLASTDKPQVGHFTDAPEVLEFLGSERLAELAALGTSCPDHFLRTKVKPMVLDLPADASIEDAKARLAELHAAYREDYAAYYHRYADDSSPAMRGADPAIVLVPGVGMFSFGKDKQTARVAGEFYVNAINVMRGAEAVSTYAPIDESEKFRIEYWALEEAKLARMPKPKPLATRIALITGAASGIGKAIAERLAAEGACVVIADLDLEKAQAVAAEIGSTDVAIGVRADVTSEDEVAAAVDAAVLAFGGLDLVVNNAGLSLSKSLLDTSVKDWDLQHDVMAKGSFLVSRAAAKVLIAQDMGGDVVYISSKNSVFAGPNNIAYSATKADQAHQVRLLAAELGEYGVKVNGINPDGVVRGSGIFAGGWGAKRAAVYGVEEEDLGKFYAQRTLLKREVLPENVANAVFALCTADLSHTTGLHIPVDAGVAAAFLR